MKVYSWKTLIVVIVCFIIAMTNSIKDLIAGDSFEILYIIIWIVFFIKGLWIAFTRNGFNNDKVNGIIAEKVMKKLFGKWRLIAQWGGLILYFVALIMLKIIPSQTWITISIFIIATIYNIRISSYINKEVKKEKRKYFL